MAHLDILMEKEDIEHDHHPREVLLISKEENAGNSKRTLAVLFCGFYGFAQWIDIAPALQKISRWNVS